MSRTALAPVFTGLRTGLHAVFAALTVLVIVRAIIVPTDSSVTIVALSVALLATYSLGALVVRTGSGAAPSASSRGGALSRLWLIVLSAQWLFLVWMTPEAAYLVFPLFFLYLHLVPGWRGPTAVVVSTIVAIYALGTHSGWSIGGVVGPLVGAGVALLIGLGYQALATESTRREALMSELLATRGLLAATEREAGILAERSRLAREIHDTVAQGLSSIQLLLYAAERADPERAGVEHIRLARETAIASLADTRRFIRELTPPQLDDQSLGGALRRLAASQWASDTLEVNVRVSDAVDIPMHVQTALLRIAQGALANVIQHAKARTVTISLDVETDAHGELAHEVTASQPESIMEHSTEHGTEFLRFIISDDGVGFDPERVADADADAGGSTTDSFGLRATRERVSQLGGTLDIHSTLGAGGSGTTLTVRLAVERPS